MPKATNAAGLTAAEERFVAELIASNNQTESYIRAFGGENRGSAAACANRLLKKAKIQAEVERRRKAALQSAELTAADVMRAIKRNLEFDLKDLQDADGSLLKLKDIPDQLRLVIQGVKWTEDGLEYKLPDRNATIKNAIDVLGMRAADKHEVDVGPTLADILERSFELEKEEK